MGTGYRRQPALVAAALLVIGLLAIAGRFDTPADPGLLRLGWSTWHSDGVVVDIPPGVPDRTLRSGVNGAERGVPMRRPSA